MWKNVLTTAVKIISCNWATLPCNNILSVAKNPKDISKPLWQVRVCNPWHTMHTCSRSQRPVCKTIFLQRDNLMLSYLSQQRSHLRHSGWLLVPTENLKKGYEQEHLKTLGELRSHLLWNWTGAPWDRKHGRSRKREVNPTMFDN